jgi:rRNA-processing protein FCF1
VLLVDAANVIGSRPTGWWRDRAAAARELVERIAQAVASANVVEPVVVVLEGAARKGYRPGEDGGLRVVHAGGSGDDELVRLAADAGEPVIVGTADRELRRRLEGEGAEVVGPNWLLSRLGEARRA